MRYSSKSNNHTKNSHKLNIFQRHTNLKNSINKVEKNIKILSQKLKDAQEGKYYKLARQYEDELYKENKYLQKLKGKYSNLKKRYATIGVTLGVSLAIAIPSFGAHISNENFDKNFTEAYNIIQQESEQDSSDSLYKQLISDIKSYVELTEKQNLTQDDEKHLKNLKSRINSNPESIAQLSLNILKKKIANSLKIDDYTKIKIIDNSTSVSADQYHPESGSLINKSISVEGKEIAALKQFISSDADLTTKTYADSIPKDVLEVLDNVVNAQSNPQDTKNAIKALKSSLKLEEKNLFINNEKANDTNEREI